MSAIMADKGDPIGIPKVCLYTKLLKVKKVKVKTNSTAKKILLDWENAKILDFEPYYYKRLISEMIHIRKQKNGLNLKKDTELLKESYFDILDGLAGVKQ